jgi:hypothetical protein
MKPRRRARLLACWAFVWSVPLAADPPRERDVIAHAGEHVERLEQVLPRIVARETMVQHAEPGTPGGTVPVRDRRLVSELSWAPLAGAPDLLAIRDVVEVDGRSLTDERGRLRALLESGQATLADAQRLLNEGARYNLAPGSRNFNLPTVVLFFLHPRTADRFSWSRQSEKSEATWRFTFKERQRPTIIRDGTGRAIFSRGAADIEAVSGIVVQTELHLRYGQVNYTLVTHFARVPALDLVLPSRMDERYETPTGTVTGIATYDDYRQFQTGGRLVQ